MLRPAALLKPCTFTLLLVLGVPLGADEGALDAEGFHSPDGFFLAPASTAPDPYFSVSRAAVSGDWAFFAYSSPGHDLAWRIVSPSGATEPCVLAVPGVKFFPVDARLDREGRLLIAGTASTSAMGRFLFVARFFLAGCSLDSSFDGDGLFVYDLPSNLSGGRLALQELGLPPFPSEKIVLGGTVILGSEPDFSDIVVLRLDEDGSYDESFGFAGAQILDYDDDDNSLVDLLIDPQDRIVVAGSAGAGIPGSDVLLIRLLVDGDPDPAFGFAGFRRFHQTGVDRGDRAVALSRAPGGDLYLAGTSSDASGNRIVVTRLSGQHGFTLDDAAWPTANGRYLRGAALQGDRRLLLAGLTLSHTDSNLFTLAFRIPELVLDPVYNDLSDLDPLSFVDLDVPGLPHEAGAGLTMADERPILTGFAADATQMADNVQPYVLRLTNDFLFADGFESGNRFAWD